jgi:hypothetical protein
MRSIEVFFLFQSSFVDRLQRCATPTALALALLAQRAMQLVGHSRVVRRQLRIRDVLTGYVRGKAIACTPPTANLARRISNVVQRLVANNLSCCQHFLNHILLIAIPFVERRCAGNDRRMRCLACAAIERATTNAKSARSALAPLAQVILPTLSTTVYSSVVS